MKKIIIIDMQNDFVTGSLGTKEAREIVPHIIDRLKEYSKADVIFTRDTHYDNYLNTLEGKNLPVTHCVKCTHGWEIIPEFNIAGAGVINKNTFGSTYLPTIMEFENLESIELCGVCTDICVISNALLLRAHYPNTKIFVHANCCAGVTPELHEAALKVMESCQIDVIR